MSCGHPVSADRSEAENTGSSPVHPMNGFDPEMLRNQCFWVISFVFNPFRCGLEVTTFIMNCLVFLIQSKSPEEDN